MGEGPAQESIPQGDESAARWTAPSLRALTLGGLWMLFLAFAIPYNDEKVQSTSMSGTHFPVGILLILLLFVLVVNVLWRLSLLYGDDLLLLMTACGLGLFATVLRMTGLFPSVGILFAASATAVLVRTGKRFRVSIWGVLKAAAGLAVVVLLERFAFSRVYFGAVRAAGVVVGLVALFIAVKVMGGKGEGEGSERSNEKRRSRAGAAGFIGAVGAGLLLAEAVQVLAPAELTGPWIWDLIFHPRIAQAPGFIASPPAWRVVSAALLAVNAVVVFWLSVVFVRGKRLSFDPGEAGRLLCLIGFAAYAYTTGEFAAFGGLSVLPLAYGVSFVGRLLAGGRGRPAKGIGPGVGFAWAAVVSLVVLAVSCFGTVFVCGGVYRWICGSGVERAADKVEPHVLSEMFRALGQWDIVAITYLFVALVLVAGSALYGIVLWRRRPVGNEGGGEDGESGGQESAAGGYGPHQSDCEGSQYLTRAAHMALSRGRRLSGYGGWVKPAAWFGIVVVLACVGGLFGWFYFQKWTVAFLLALVVPAAGVSVAGLASFVALRRRPLSSSELVVMFILIIAGGGIPGYGLVRYLHPFMAAPAYYADPRNDWEHKLLPHIPPCLVASRDPKSEVVVRWYEGYRDSELAERGQTIWEAIPWGAWIRPTLAWLVVMFLILFAYLCLSVILRKQWEERERLSFPLMQVPEEMVKRPAAGKLLNDLFSSRLMWIGAMIPIVIHMTNGLHTFYPQFPKFDTYISVWRLFWRGGGVWANMEWFGLRIFITVIGFTYLLPQQVSLGIWLFFVFTQLELVFGGWMGFTIDGARWRYNMTNHQQEGAYLAYMFFMIWAARRHLADIARSLAAEMTLNRLWEAAAWAGIPLMYILLAYKGFLPEEALAAAGIYMLAVPLGRVLARSEGHARDLIGCATAAALLACVTFRWSSLVVMLTALIEFRRKIRAGPSEPYKLAPVFAAALPVLAGVALISKRGLGIGEIVLLSAIYLIVFVSPHYTRRFFSRAEPIALIEGVGALLMPIAGGAVYGRMEVGMLCGIAYGVLGPLARVTRAYVAEASEVDDSEEAMSYRTAITGLVGSVLLVAYLAHVYAGVSFGMALVVLGMILTIAVVLTRIVVQGGMPYVQSKVQPAKAIAAFGGGRALGLFGPNFAAARNSVIMMYWMDGIHIHDMGNLLLPTMMNTFKLGGGFKLNRRHIMWVMVFAVLLATVVACIVKIYVAYRYGGLSMRQWSMRWSPTRRFRGAVRTIEHPPEFGWGKFLATSWGFGLMTGLLSLATRFHWWPVHPIGLLLFPSWPISCFWWSVMIGWLIKSVIVKYGGGGAFKRARPFFMGLIVGDCLVGGFWIVVGLVLGERVISIMPG